jgi:D-beta-D-heptose 7-phosphate kinase/D-beta-D-heptose 1-phosphate adenosyltransferase
MQQLLERISGLRILVVGDLMLDHYLWGDATRISPEAPVPVVKADRDTYTAGGAANVANNLRSLGVTVDLVGTIGTDTGADELSSILSSRGIVLDTALADACRSTIQKTRVMCRNQQLCRIDREDTAPAYALPAAYVADILPDKIAAADAVIVSDYAKGVVTSDLIRTIRRIAGSDKLIALDPKPRSGLEFYDMGLITPNRNEALQLAQIQGVGPSDPFPAAEVCSVLHERYATRLLVITLGADGMMLSADGVPLRQIPTAARAVFDVSGAGDTVAAVLTAALAAGADPEKAAQLANQAAGVVVEKIGTATATPAEILAHAKVGLTV